MHSAWVRSMDSGRLQVTPTEPETPRPAECGTPAIIVTNTGEY